MCFQVTLNDVPVSLKYILRRAAPVWHIFILCVSSFCFLSSVLEKSIRWWQNCPATPSCLVSPLIFFIVHGSRTLKTPPAPLPSPSYLRQSTGHSPLTPSMWRIASLFLTGWVWPLTLWADSSIGFLWHQSCLGWSHCLGKKHRLTSLQFSLALFTQRFAVSLQKKDPSVVFFSLRQNNTEVS